LIRALARLAVVLAAGGCATAPPQPAVAAAAELLKNGDFALSPSPNRDCPPQWWCTVHADPAAFRFGLERDPRSGKRLLRVERVGNEPWALVSQVVPARSLAGKRIRLRVRVDTSGFEGEGAGAVLVLRSLGDEVLAHERHLQPRMAGWQTVAVELVVVPGTETVSAGLAVEGGGVVRFDEARLEVLGPGAASP